MADNEFTDALLRAYWMSLRPDLLPEKSWQEFRAAQPGLLGIAASRASILAVARVVVERAKAEAKYAIKHDGDDTGWRQCAEHLHERFSALLPIPSPSPPPPEPSAP